MIIFITLQFFAVIVSSQPAPDFRKYFLTEELSKEFFTFFESLKLSRVNPETGLSEVSLTDNICAITIQYDRQGQRHQHIGCSWYDQFQEQDMTGYNDAVEPLYHTMIKEFGLDCDDQDTCISSAEKIKCTYSHEKYLCEVEFWYFYPGPKADLDAPIPGAEPDPTEDEL